MKTSINFKAVKTDSEAHNFRRKTFDYIKKDLTGKNEYWVGDKISDRLKLIETYCKEKSGRKLQKNALPIREAVVVIKENTTMQDLHKLSKRLEEELKIRIFQIAIHRDEGHYDKDSKEWKPNYHAHLVADWQDLETGKTLKHQSFHYSKMQDITAECLEMDRGVSGSKGRLEAIEFKIQKKEEEFLLLNNKITEIKATLNSKKFEDLIVKEDDFLGFSKIKTDKTIENYERAFKSYNTELLKNKETLQSKTKIITELQQKNIELTKEVSLLQNKLSTILSNTTAYTNEKDIYFDSVKDTIIKAIRFEKFKQPKLFDTTKEKVISIVDRICKKASEENNIPFSSLEEIFKNPDSSLEIFSLLNFDNHGTKYNTEDIQVQQKRKKIKRSQ
ncbi:plasmid recombination protein [Chryseobacterium sp. X308]|nr:plasmid recombination protein [Chryseobacterium sp. X308]